MQITRHYTWAIRQDDSVDAPPPCRPCRRGDHDRCEEPCGCFAPDRAHAEG